MCQRVFIQPETKFQLDPTRDKDFPIDPHYKNRPLSIDMTLQKWAIFIMELYGENLCLLSDQAEILFVVI